jgi:hypothetical protein
MEDNLFIFNFNFIMNKKIISDIIIFVVAVILLDFTIGRILHHFYFTQSAGFDFRTTTSIEKTEADILIFGSSRANHHYVPEVFEDSLKMTFYNTGRDGISIFYQLAVLKSVLQRYKPKIIIFDYIGSFGKDKIQYERLSCLLPYYRTHPEIRKIIELRSPYEKIKLISETYPFNSHIVRIVIGNLGINKKRRQDDKGYIPIFNEWQTEVDSAQTIPLYVVDSQKVIAFQEFIKQVKESGVKVFVVYSPLFLKFKMSQEIEICKNICSNEKIPFWDFSRDTSFHNHKYLFYDINHLNHKGAKIFSSIIATKIKATLNSPALN